MAFQQPRAIQWVGDAIKGNSQRKRQTPKFEENALIAWEATKIQVRRVMLIVVDAFRRIKITILFLEILKILMRRIISRLNKDGCNVDITSTKEKEITMWV